MKKTLDATAQVITYLFAPVWIPLASIFLVFQTNSLFKLLVPPPIQTLTLLVVFFFTLLMPTVTILLMRHYKMVQSFNMPNRLERRLPLLLSCIYLTLAYFAVKRMSTQFELIPHLSLLMMAGVLVLVTATVINIWYKISIHMTCIGSVLGMLTAFAKLNNPHTFELICLVILVSGLVGFARLQLKAHTPGQVFWGYLVGFGVEYFVLSIL